MYKPKDTIGLPNKRSLLSRDDNLWLIGPSIKHWCGQPINKCLFNFTEWSVRESYRRTWPMVQSFKTYMYMKLIKAYDSHIKCQSFSLYSLRKPLSSIRNVSESSGAEMGKDIPVNWKSLSLDYLQILYYST